MYTRCKIFGSELKDSFRRFGVFAKENKGIIIVLSIALLFLYGSRIFYYDISFDSEIALISQKTITDSWLGINRFGLVFTKWLFQIDRFVPYASNFLMILVLGFSAFFLTFCLEEWRGGRHRFFSFVFPLAYVSAPCLAEQFYFSLQSFEIAWATLLCIVSVYALSQWIFRKKSPLWLLLSLPAMVWSFASYQAFAALFIALALVSFILYYQNEEFGQKTGWIIYAVKYILIFCIGFIIYLLAAKLVRLYFGLDSSYVDSMMLWGTQGIGQCLENIKGEIGRVYLSSWPLFFRNIFTPALIIVTCLFLYRGWKKHRKSYWLYLIACLLLILSPVYLSIISGNYQPIRGQLVYPFAFAFFVAGLTTFRPKALSCICLVVALLFILSQGQNMTQLFHTAYMSYEQDKALASSIYDRISQAGADQGLTDYSAVFVGASGTTLPADALEGDVIGHSFFEWDSTAQGGSTSRILDFFRTLGYDISTPSAEQIAAAGEQAQSMPSWPATDSVRLMENGCFVIKLSD